MFGTKRKQQQDSAYEHMGPRDDALGLARMRLDAALGDLSDVDVALSELYAKRQQEPCEANNRAYVSMMARRQDVAKRLTDAKADYKTLKRKG